MKKRVFSGIKPTGKVHIGNYLGAIKHWVESQDNYENIFCVVDLHAITVPQDSKELKALTRELAGVLFAAGIDPLKSSLFIQSHLGSLHTELAWILNCFIPMGWMERMTQFKEKSEGQRETVSVGLFDYPALMAADILLYETDEVPVGEDQKQHVELTRDVAGRFNSIYGETFKLPEPVIAEIGARIMGLENPAKKMSKSEGGEGNVIYVLDTPETIRSKIMKATTDSENKIVLDEKRPGIFNLLTIYQLFTELPLDQIEEKFKGSGYGEFKKELAEVIVEGLAPLQKRYQELTADPTRLESLLKEGAEKIRPIAEKTLIKVKNKTGLG